jgi:hypothetical protein
LESLISQYYTLGQSIGEQYFAVSRLSAGIETPYTTVLGPDLVPEALTKSLGVTGPSRFKQVVSQGQAPEIAREAAIQAQLGVADRYLHNGSRGAVMSNVKKDKRAVGWQRLSSTGTPCAFCALLISRGPVYKSEGQASFDVHDNDHCFAEPFFTDQAQSAPIAQEYRNLYDEAIQHTSGQDSINAFRRAYQHKYMPDLYKKPQEAS